MPKFRGITLSVNAHWDHKQFPEFAHPDSRLGSVRLPPELNKDDTTNFALPSKVPSFESSADASGMLVEAPVIAVYIPSQPCTRFFLRYSISPPYPNSQQVFFKLLMNGRHIVSWGVNPRLKPRGQVMRAMFRADKTSCSTESGSTGDIETRALWFAGDNRKRAAAHDGGLIEVQVYRAKGKRRRVPIIQSFREQDQYGLSLPTEGLVETPQDMRFFDWLLTDSADSPYATFRFHYRSWDSLHAQQLISSKHPRVLLPTSHSFGTLAEYMALQDPVKRGGGEGDSDSDSDESLPPRCPPRSLLRPDTPQGQISGILKNASRSVRYSVQNELNTIVQESLKQPAEDVFDTTDHNLRLLEIQPLSIPEDLARNSGWDRDRPLPEPPKKPTPAYQHKKTGSKSSVSSYAPSVTTSLASWFNGLNSREASPEHILGKAVSVPMDTMQGELKDVGDWSTSMLCNTSIDDTDFYTTDILTPPSNGALPKIPSNIVSPRVSSLQNRISAGKKSRSSVRIETDNDNTDTSSIIDENEDPFSLKVPDPDVTAKWLNMFQTKSFVTRRERSITFAADLTSIRGESSSMCEEGHRNRLDSTCLYNDTIQAASLRDEPDLLRPGAWPTRLHQHNLARSDLA